MGILQPRSVLVVFLLWAQLLAHSLLLSLLVERQEARPDGKTRWRTNHPLQQFLLPHSLQENCHRRSNRQTLPLWYKSGDRETATNYRPISLLPIVSKLLEKIVSTQLKAFLASNNLLPEIQFAYRANHPTEDDLALIVNRLLLERDCGKATGLVFVDLSKAFDRVKHQALIDLLSGIGICDTVLGRRSGQSVTASDFGSNGPRFESGRGRCVESLDKALYSHCPKEKPSH